jgi:ribosome-associated protein
MERKGGEMVKITTEFITLGQFLKMTDWIDSGGQAKIAVKTLKIFVNDEKEDRRGRKLYPGDSVKIEGKTYLIEK